MSSRAPRFRGHAVVLVLMAVVGAADAATWRQHTFEDFRQGWSDDGGVNLYAAADGTVRTIYTFDYNRDGANDVLFVCGHDNCYAPPAYIYMNGPGGFTPRFRWLLLTNGAHAGTLADVNEDGWLDAILCGTSNGMNFDAVDAIVYYGSEQGYAKRRSTRLPTFQSGSVALIDCNGDGRRDLVFAQGHEPGLIIYYNNDNGVDAGRSDTINCPAVSCCRVADVNEDGHDDLLALSGNQLFIYKGSPTGLHRNEAGQVDVKETGRFAVGDANGDRHLDIAVTNPQETGDALIHWGDGRGCFALRSPTPIPSASSRDVAIADFNRDGYGDIAVANFGSDNATGDAPTTIFWSNKGEFDPARKQDLQTRFAHGLAVADLNDDGWPDLVIACRRTGETHNTDSFIYFNRQGTFPEQERVGVPTLGAVTAIVGDVDRNGRPDVMFCHGVDGTVGLMDSRIYWNDGRGSFSTERMTLVPSRDSFGHAAADLNLDGYLDLVFPNSYEYGRFRDEGSYVYWGEADSGWSPERRTIVPTNFATGVVTADLNRDGWLDLAFAQLSESLDARVQYKKNVKASPVFWGSPDGYSEDRASWLDVENPRGLTLGDLDKDGWVDLVYSNLTYDFVPIYWGTPGGYSNERKTELHVPNKGSVSVNCADVNNDGWLDLLVVCIYDYSNPQRITTDRDSYVYLGSPDGFDPARRIALPTVGGDQASIADFDRDGRLDIFFGNYTNGHIDRTWSSYVYYNGPAGFTPACRTGLFTNSGSGNVALDFNRDGWLDLAVACHMMPNGDHRAYSFLFYGGPEGFSDYSKLELPTCGAHETTFVDAGHIYHRRYEIAYTSAVYEADRTVVVGAVSWHAETPHRSRLRFQVRAADRPESLEQSAWVGAEGAGSYIDEPGERLGGRVKGRFVQYRALFTSHDGSNYPVLHEVNIDM